MHEHQQALLPVEQLQDVPQPVVVLLEAFLEKDPARRFQNPTELLKAIATVTDAIDRGRKIPRVSLRNAPSTGSNITRKPLTRRAPKKISIARLPVTGSDVLLSTKNIASVTGNLATEIFFGPSRAVDLQVPVCEAAGGVLCKLSRVILRPASIWVVIVGITFRRSFGVQKRCAGSF